MLRDAKKVVAGYDIPNPVFCGALLKSDREETLRELKRVLCKGTLRVPLHEVACCGCGINVWCEEGEVIAWCKDALCLAAALDAVLWSRHA